MKQKKKSKAQNTDSSRRRIAEWCENIFHVAVTHVMSRLYLSVFFVVIAPHSLKRITIEHELSNEMMDEKKTTTSKRRQEQSRINECIALTWQTHVMQVSGCHTYLKLDASKLFFCCCFNEMRNVWSVHHKYGRESIINECNDRRRMFALYCATGTMLTQ